MLVDAWVGREGGEKWRGIRVEESTYPRTPCIYLFIYFGGGSGVVRGWMEVESGGVWAGI